MRHHYAHALCKTGSRISHRICFTRVRTRFVVIFINQPARKDLAWPGCHDNNIWLAIFNLSLNKIIFPRGLQTWKYNLHGFYNSSYLLYIVIWVACYTRIIPISKIHIAEGGGKFGIPFLSFFYCKKKNGYRMAIILNADCIMVHLLWTIVSCWKRYFILYNAHNPNLPHVS